MSWGNPQTISEYVRAILLSPLASAYGLGNCLNKFVYDKGLSQKRKLPVPIISIGNITCGGTGKTPIVIEIANRLIDSGLKIGILSRGYKKQSSSQTVVVSDGKGNLATPAESGDEPWMIAKSVEQAVVISGTDRYTSGMMAARDFNCDMLILDDGFQHYRLERDLNCVLIDYSDQPGKDSLLPAGRLREPLAGLARASQIIITKIPVNFDQHKLDSFDQLIHRFAPSAKISLCRFVPRQMHTFVNGQLAKLPISNLSGLKVVTFCGLARPQSFASEVSALGAEVLASEMFPDHHWYTKSDLNMLTNRLEQTAARFLVTTEKDFVKLQLSPIREKLLVIELQVQWLKGFPEIIQSFANVGKQISPLPGALNNPLIDGVIDEAAR